MSKLSRTKGADMIKPVHMGALMSTDRHTGSSVSDTRAYCAQPCLAHSSRQTQPPSVQATRARC
jgi:nitrate reductase cytochrome c-type subunit